MFRRHSGWSRRLCWLLVFAVVLPFQTERAPAQAAALPAPGPQTPNRIRVSKPVPHATPVKPEEDGQSPAPTPPPASVCHSKFPDVKDTDWACVAIDIMRSLGVMQGYPGGTFRPVNPVKRGETAALLVRRVDEDPAPNGKLTFTDPHLSDHWAARQGYIQAAVAIGAVNGLPDGTFDPEGHVTRGQLVKMVAAAAGLDPASDLSGLPYSDIKKQDDWFAGWVQSAYKARLIGKASLTGLFPENQAFAGTQAATRAEVAALLFNTPVRGSFRRNIGYVSWTQYVKGVSITFGNFVRTYTDARVEQSKGPVVQIERTYNAFGNEDQSFGPHWSFNFDTRIISLPTGARVVLPSGRHAVYTLQGDGSFKAEPGVFEHLELRSDGTYQLTDRADQRYSFTRTGRLSRIIDRNGNAVRFEPDPANPRRSTITDADGHRFGILRDDAGRIQTITDPVGQTWTYSYDPATGDLVRTDDPDGVHTHFHYDNHKLDWIKGPLAADISADAVAPAQRVDYYPTSGRVHNVYDADGHPTVYDYNPLEFKTTVTDPEGGVTTLFYDDLGRVLRRWDALNHFEEFGYDDDNNVTHYRSKNLGDTGRQYDDRGNLISETNAVGEHTTWQYHPRFNLPVLITRPLGFSTKLDYDDTGNLLTRTEKYKDPTSGKETVLGVTSYTYYPDGQIHTVTGPRSTGDQPMVTTFQYYPSTSTRQVRDNLGLVAETTLDALGRKSRETNGVGQEVKYAYFSTGQPRTVTTPLGVTTYRYAPSGSLTFAEDPAGNRTEYPTRGTFRTLSVARIGSSPTEMTGPGKRATPRRRPSSTTRRAG
ncbi:MAG TPA: S-layer homology domain-containing protein [Symbiobacteriaceae bacterium]